MGPDERPSREELGLIVKLMFAKFEQQAEIITALSGLLVSSGAITDKALNSMLIALQSTDRQKKLQVAGHNFESFVKIHKISRQYLDQLGEDAKED